MSLSRWKKLQSNKMWESTDIFIEISSIAIKWWSNREKSNQVVALSYLVLWNLNFSHGKTC